MKGVTVALWVCVVAWAAAAVGDEQVSRKKREPQQPGFNFGGFQGNIPVPFGNVGFNFGQNPGRQRRPGRPQRQQRPQRFQQNTPQTFERG
ncbi:uncharacterized protein [Penaeus vannamei]|uniref:uncharacterized protein n=1 Tax=Penaeus vannamei TaxID=6689 RepID=UPI00387F5C63